MSTETTEFPKTSIVPVPLTHVTQHALGPPEPRLQYIATSSHILADFSTGELGGAESSNGTNFESKNEIEALMGSKNSKQVLKPNGSGYKATDPTILEEIRSDGACKDSIDVGNIDYRFGQRYHRPTRNGNIIVTHRHMPRDGLELMQDCNVCAESKPVIAFPILSVSSQCTHAPATCLECVETSIQTEFKTKRWNDIHCPECHALMEYQDVERYADKETFARYQNLAFRGAVGEAPGFVWCPANCGSGQIHEAGNDQPIIRCAKCRHKFCFRHQVAWHEQLTCAEYDGFLEDPVHFRSRFDIESEEFENKVLAERLARHEQEDADRRYAQTLLDADHVAGANRQAAKERAERDRQAAAERARVEAERKNVWENTERMRRDAAKRKADEEKSEKLVKKTTKPCPNCGWAIEKNEGCSHMTCRSYFLQNVLNLYLECTRFPKFLPSVTPDLTLAVKCFPSCLRP
ncbi:hypothetical protein BJ170DRAFT_488770 [Xylariales sp. AK1849]|nr:hypothetical protein BJ170DRAFT_488770 [Xylariales sp. AK1849]